MYRKLKQRTEGFTIIEVLIVLAIAGLILLIVFLAVPALQRNSRNTQRKNDVAAVLGAVSEFGNNNNGKIPDKCSFAAPAATFDLAAGGATTSQAKVGYYNTGCANPNAIPGSAAGTVQMLTASVTVAGGAAPVFKDAAHDYVAIIPKATCSGNAVAAGSARQVAAVYEIETGGGYSQVCQES